MNIRCIFSRTGFSTKYKFASEKFIWLEKKGFLFFAVHKNASIILFHHYLQWTASPTADMYADAVMKVILKAQDLDNSSVSVPTNMNPTFDKMHFKVSDKENVFLYRLEYY